MIKKDILKNCHNLQIITNFMQRFLKFICYLFHKYATVINYYQKGFHDKKRRLNYYRVKLILWKKEGNTGPMEIT